MASTGEVWKLGHRPALDGLRGVAVLLVVVGHGWQDPLLAAGSTGVGVFFTLSGFLITALLLEERDQGGTIRLASFYARRATRLLPALYVFLVVVALAGPLLGPHAPSPLSLVAVVLYVGNWLPAAFHYNLGLAIGHTWSLAVEEQFYLVWPLLLLAAARLRARWFMWGCLVLAAGAFAWRATLFVGGDIPRSYAGTDTCVAGMLVGAAVAVAAREYRWAPPRWLAGLAAVTLGALSLGGDSVVGWMLAPGLAPIPTAVIVLAVARGVALPLGQPWLALVGRRSYGVYLWHAPMLLVVAPALPLPHGAAAALMIAVTWAVATLSWRFVEAPAQRRQRRRQDGLAASQAETSARSVVVSFRL